MRGSDLEASCAEIHFHIFVHYDRHGTTNEWNNDLFPF
ncbi:hypothetical protein IMSAGC016_00803 [Muribaculaceae bacterium]|nr:hypothetical protein IMSAGC016_00803 [Muribaculaceae bacterium]